ncbi:transcriptional regulator GcvA [Consotaella aegiceratis]|uniref:transcriptional regulator GcvA n=1 Tax=Consotaella aegiceratis TaxID=3097961 RepID=UPI002F418FCA
MEHRDLPPLAAVRVFEAAARHLSFTKAAAELGMTQAAVSYQIKLLEERVGAPLFLRKPRSVSLTPSGQMLAPATTDALDLIASSYAAVRGSIATVLSITVLATFAANWLAPRIGSFQMKHPDIAVRFDTTNEMLDFARHDVDVALRSGSGGWPGLVGHRLLPVDFAPMLSPRLLERFGPLREPADLLRFPLIAPRDPWWAVWFERAGVTNYDPEKHPNSFLGTQYLESRAAIGGLGVAILSSVFYQQEVADGLLQQPFDLVADEGRSYWLCYAENRRNVPKIRAFRDWILAEMEQSRSGAGLLAPTPGAA